MPKTIVKIKLWYCTNLPCTYHQEAEPTATFMGQSFPSVPVGKCPACFLGQNPQRTKAIVDMIFGRRLNQKDEMVVMGEEDIEPEITVMLKDEKRKQEVDTEAKKDAYRAKRKIDISNAIIEAKKFEDV